MAERETTASFGYWVRRQRLALDLTQAALARSVGCATVTITKIERDERRPSRQMATLLAANLSIPENDLELFLAVARGQKAADGLSVATQPRAPQGVAAQQQLDSDLPPTELEVTSAQRRGLVGRHDEWQQLQDVWRLVQGGEARCVLLWGEAGIGKTHLAEELINWVQRQGFPWASSRSYAVEGALTYAPVAEWLRSSAIRQALAEIDDLWRVELARLLPDLLVDRSDLPQPGPMTESWQQQRFFQSIVQAISATKSPLMLHLDDMQWTDVETLTLLQFLLHAARNRPLLLLGGIRSEDAGRNEALAEFVAATRHAGVLSELRLGPLSAKETTELAVQTIGDTIDPAIAEALYAGSEGHPLYLIESVRSGLNRSHLASENEESQRAYSYDSSVLPPRIHRLLATRLDQLSPSAIEVASVAAVIGRSFDYSILGAAVSLDEVAFLDALDELLRQQMIREQPGNRYDFSHDRIREVTYLEVNRARRRFYHRQVAGALESVHGDNLDEFAGELAAHFAQAGDAPAAYGYYRRAANYALSQYGLQDAVRMFDAALTHGPDDPVERIHVLLEQNIALQSALQSDRWRENLGIIEALLASIEPDSPSLRFAWLMDRSRYFDVLGHGQEGAEAAKSALLVAEALNDRNALAHAHELLASNYWKAGMMQEAGRAFEEAAKHAHVTGDSVLEGKMLSAQVRNGMFTDMPSTQVHQLLTRMLAFAQSKDDRELMMDSLGKLGYWQIALGMGNFDQGEQYLRQVIRIGKESGSVRDLVMRYGNLGWLFVNKGDYRQALIALDASQQISDESSSYFNALDERRSQGCSIHANGVSRNGP